jgi:tetratricopeptide (TPR) repeat protein
MKTAFAVFLCSLLFFACEETKKVPDIKKLQGLTPTIAKFDEGNKPVIQKVAILPFTNSTKEATAADIVRKSVYGHFSWLPYEDTELRYTDTILQDKGIVRGKEETTRDYAVRAGKSLGVDGVILGTIHHYDQIFAGIYAQIAVGGKLSFVSVHDGTILWELDYTERAHEGGIPLDPIGAIATMVKCGISLNDINLFHAVNDFAKNTTATIPEYYSLELTIRQKHEKSIQSQQKNIEQEIQVKKEILKKSALEIETEVNLLVLAGDALVREGKRDLAIETFQEAVDLKPDYTEIHFQLSLLYAERGELRKALYEMDRCIELQPEFPEFYYSRGLLFMEMREKLHLNAVDDFQTYRNLAPEKAAKVRYLLKRLGEQ